MDPLRLASQFLSVGRDFWKLPLGMLWSHIDLSYESQKKTALLERAVTPSGAIHLIRLFPEHPCSTFRPRCRSERRLDKQRSQLIRQLAPVGLQRRQVDHDGRHIVLPLHVSHAVEEEVQLLLRQRRAESRDTAGDLAPRGVYGFRFSFVVHWQRRGS